MDLLLIYRNNNLTNNYINTRKKTPLYFEIVTRAQKVKFLYY